MFEHELAELERDMSRPFNWKDWLIGIAFILFVIVPLAALGVWWLLGWAVGSD